MMNSVRKRKLLFILFVLGILTIAALLVLYALRQNISLFYSPSQIAQGEVLDARNIRIGGMVLPGSIHRGKTNLNIDFDVTDYKNTIHITYHGVLPDLFREGQGVIAQGVYDPLNKQFNAVEILAKHDENYMPPEVKQALAQSKETQQS